VSVRTDPLGPILWILRPDRAVVINEEGEVIRNKVLPRAPEIDWIIVLEALPQLIHDVCVLLVLGLYLALQVKAVIEEIVIQQLALDTASLSVQVPILQNVRDGVECVIQS